MGKTAVKFLLLSINLFFAVYANAQTITQEYGDISISPDNFVTGVFRRTAMDVQKSTGKSVYVYTEKEADPSTYKDLWCVIYNSDMTVLVSPFRVNATTTNDQLYPFVLVNQNDNSFYVTWTDYRVGAGAGDIYAKKISFDITNATSSSYTSATDVLINDITSGDQNVSIMAMSYKYNELVFGFRDTGNDGGGASSQGVYLKRINPSNLSVISNQFLAQANNTNNQVLNSIDIKNDYLIISYTSNHNTANSHDLYARVYNITDPPGAAPVTYTLTTDIQVNNYTSGDQNNSNLSINETTGQFAITWSSQQDGSGFGAYAKVYSNNPITIIKDEFLVNSVTANNELLSKVLWEESTNQLMFFFHYSLTGFGTLKYRFFDGATVPGQYNPVSADQDLIGGLDTKTYYQQFYNVFYNSYTNRLNLAYELYDSYSTFNTKTKARTYIFHHPNIDIPSFVNSTDLDKNWIHTRQYAEDGTILSEDRDYYDNLGNTLQSQTRNLEENIIFAQMQVYDKYNNAVLNTLPAPIPDQLFTYHSDFITPSGSTSPYSYNDFDQPNTTNHLAGEINNPKAIDANSVLGKYYSDNNTLENLVANSSFPYSRTNYNYSIVGGTVSSTNVGDEYRMGQGYEAKKIVLPVLKNELLHYTTLRKNYFSNSFRVGDIINATKTISKDLDGNEVVIYYDNHSNVLAKGISGGSDELQTNTSLNSDFYYYDILSDANHTFINIVIESAANIEIYDFSTSTTWSGSASGNPYHSLSGSSGHIQVRATQPFRVTYSNINNATLVNTLVRIEPDRLGSRNSSVDLHIQNSSYVHMTTPTWANVKIENLTDGTVVYDGISISTCPNVNPGYYRITMSGMPPASSTYIPSDIVITTSNFYKDISYYFYDDAGRNIASVAPKGVIRTTTTLPKFVTSYKYSTSDRLLRETDPDKGTKDFVYRNDGLPRFSKDSRQAAETVQTFSYLTYDSYGRLIQLGEYRGTTCNIIFESHLDGTNLSNGTNALLNSTAIDGGLGTCRFEPVTYSYDFPDGTSPNSRIQNFTKGSEIVKTSNDAVTTWYSYDYEGRIEWTQQKVTGLITNGSDVKTCDYTYDLKGNVTNIVYQRDITAERFEHKYTYDKNQNLSKVESRKGNALYQEEAEYKFYKHGAIKRVEVANDLQGIDYVYTLQGNLKSINHSSLDEQKDPGLDGYTSGAHTGFAKDVFGMTFQYHASDYVKTGSNIQNTTINVSEWYGGNVKAIRWKTRGNGMGSNNDEELVYAYNYDDKSQLTQADFGTVSPSDELTFITHMDHKYKVYGLSYDLNGNIMAMSTNDATGNLKDNFAYENGGLNGSSGYTNPVDNKLAGVATASTSNYYGKYEYDAIGRLTKDIDINGHEKRVKYNFYNLVTEVRDESDVLKVSYTYNDKGYRVKKITYNSSGAVSYTTWYVRDIDGNVLSEYNDKAVSGTYQQTELPIYGYNRLGAAYINGSQTDYIYELTDHLGNLRASISRQKDSYGQAAIITWKDYYPYGDIMDNRQSAISTIVPDKYGYQSCFSEKDDETQWGSFELRMYNPRIGKFLSGDPYSQHWSSFMAMGNNPIISVDPDGGEEIDESVGGNGYAGGHGDGTSSPGGGTIGSYYSGYYATLWGYNSANAWGFAPGNGYTISGTGYYKENRYSTFDPRTGTFSGSANYGWTRSGGTGISYNPGATSYYSSNTGGGYYGSTSDNSLPVFPVLEEESEPIYQNTKKYIDKHGGGNSITLTYNGGGSARDVKSRKVIAHSKLLVKPGYQRDEFPYGSAKEGDGSPDANGNPDWAEVKHVPERHNRIQGGKLSLFYRANGMKANDQFIVILIPKDNSQKQPYTVPITVPTLAPFLIPIGLKILDLLKQLPTPGPIPQRYILPPIIFPPGFSPYQQPFPGYDGDGPIAWRNNYD